MARTDFDSRVWGGLMLRGIVAILFGILALSRPGITAAGLVFLFGAYAFFDGIFALVASMDVAQLKGRWGGMFFAGLCGIAIGVITFTRPAAAATGLVVYIAVWAVLCGILEIAAAVRLRQVVEGEWLLAIAGVLSIVAGLLIGARPAAGLLSIVWVIGLFAIMFGAMLVGLAFRLRGAERRIIAT